MNQRRILRNLEKVERMAGEFKDFLATYKRGGDWNIDRFMKEIECSIKEARELIEEGNEGNDI